VVRVADTVPPAHTLGGSNVSKYARRENRLTLQLPPSIALGETIRADVERGACVERAWASKR